MRQIYLKLIRKINILILFSLVILFPLIISNNVNFTNNNLNNLSDFNSDYNPEDRILSSSDLENPWVGIGNNRTVYTYLYNLSYKENQENGFNITVDTSPSESYSGIFNFTFDSEYNTTYVIENDSPLSCSFSNISSRANQYWQPNNITGPDHAYLEIGTPVSGHDNFSQLADTDLNTYYAANSEYISQNNIINFIYEANFTTVLDFNKTETLGFIYNILYRSTKDVDFKLYIYNYYDSKWEEIDNTVLYSSIKALYSKRVPNTNIKYFNENNQTKFKISVNSSIDSFEFRIYDIKVEILRAIEVPITNTNWVALEFDLKGNSTLYGFFAWIRTRQPEQPNANLTISLYRANQTTVRTEGQGVLSPLIIAAEPKTLIWTRNITNFSGDSYQFIPFKEDYSGIPNMNISNYFIVISSNVSERIYSITTIPYGKGSGYPDLIPDPDNKINHLFLYSENSGVSGSWKKKFLTSNVYQVDAAPFSISLKRPWIPNEEINITLDGTPLTPFSITDDIFENTSGWHWGLGKWEGIFENKTTDINKNITISLNWNKNISSSIHFNVYYNITIRSIEQGLVRFNASYNKDPVWEINYTYNSAKYPNWNFIKFDYIMPKDWAPSYKPPKLIAPDGSDISQNYTGPFGYGEYNIYGVLNQTVSIKGNGNYSLYCNSSNYIYETISYINIANYSWITNAFMQGDNISVLLGIFNGTNTNSHILNNGTAICEFYDSLGNLVPSLTLIDNEFDRKINTPQKVVYYEFNKSVMINSSFSYNLTKDEYNILFKWNNGDEIGFKKHTIYITDYSATINEIDIDEETKSNIVIASVKKNKTDETSYKYSIFAINKTDPNYRPSEPYINQTINKLYNDFKIQISNIIVNETLLNPGENIEINVSVVNTHPALGFNVKLQIQFNQLINQQWISFEVNTSESFLNMSGTINDSYLFNITCPVPSNFIGINAPIRLNPMIMSVTPYIEGIKKDPVPLDYIFPFVNFTEDEFEGKVLGYQADLPNSAPVIIKSIPRNNSIIPGNTTYLLQIYSNKFVSTNYSIIKTFESNLLSEFDEISTKDSVIWNKNYVLQGYLLDELKNPIPNQTISIDYWNGSEWLAYYKVNFPISNLLQTDSTGFFSDTFNSSVFNKSDLIKIRLSYQGNVSYYQTSKIITINPIVYENQISISLINSTDKVDFKIGQSNTICFKIQNKGNSTLNIIQYEFKVKSNIEEFEVLENQQDIQIPKIIKPTESITFTFIVIVPNSAKYNAQANVTLIINATACESEESLSELFEIQLNLVEYTLFDNFTQLIINLFLFGVIIIIFYSMVRILKIRKKLQEVPPEAPSRRRYVEVSELTKELEKEKSIKETEEKEKEKKSTDIDKLLEEEGID